MTIDSEREMTLYTLEWYKALKDKNDLDLNVLELLIDVEHAVNKLECSKQKISFVPYILPITIYIP